MPLYPLSDVDASYIAGIIDGEGSISILMRHPKAVLREKSPQYAVVVRVAMTDEHLIRWLQRVTNVGQVYVQQRRERKHKDAWSWVLTSTSGSELLTRVLPFLRVKREQAELFLEMVKIRKQSSRKGMRRGELSQFMPERQREIGLLCQALNKRGA